MHLQHIKKYLRKDSLKEGHAGTTICWPVVTIPEIDEEAHCLQFCRTFTRKSCLNSGFEVQWVDYHPDIELGRLAAQCSGNRILLVTNPKLLISISALNRLISASRLGYAACGPVYNLTDYPQQLAELPAAYLNISSYEEILNLMDRERKITCRPAQQLDPGCVLFESSFLFSWGIKHPAAKVKVETIRHGHHEAAVELGSLVHNFGEYFAGERDDLIRLVPEGCRRILDVGCAAGMYGRKLKEHIPDLQITGVELNPAMAELAKEHYDHVLVQPVQEIIFDSCFDLINCGDVLEHLEDPWAVLNKLYTLLDIPGYLVLSVPNVGHWTVVRDLLQGRFEYVPWGLLCVSHIHWFTEESIREALDNTGFTIDVFERQQIPPTPQGEYFIGEIIRQNLGDETSLRSNEFLIRATKRKRSRCKA